MHSCLKFTLVLPCISLAACTAPKPDVQPVPQVINVYPVVPANFLNCSPEPAPSQILTDVQLAQFTESVRIAGADCRSRLQSVRGVVDSWPK